MANGVNGPFDKRNGAIDIGGSTFQLSTPFEMINNDLINNADIIDPSKNKSVGGQVGLDIIRMLNLSMDELNPFVNGYFYIHMQNGTWVDYFNGSGQFNKNNTINTTTYSLRNIASKAGKYIFNTDLPNMLMETETVSGRLRNVNYATKMQLLGDFSINYHDNNNLDLLTYHVAWFKFIEALRRGDIEPNSDDWESDDGQAAISPFIRMPYYNAMWVLVFKPFSTIPVAIFKLMGITPVSLPLQQILGDRGAPTIGTFNQTFKCNDVVFDFKGNDTFNSYSEKNINTDGTEVVQSTYNILLNEFTKVFKNT